MKRLGERSGIPGHPSYLRHWRDLWKREVETKKADLQHRFNNAILVAAVCRGRGEGDPAILRSLGSFINPSIMIDRRQVGLDSRGWSSRPAPAAPPAVPEH
ncbi:hypothetical protein J6590_002771 [Homalodisca vitripennis]|nr:hypothetical protein J6590_002771 [Homalodisca vitripennis]